MMESETVVATPGVWRATNSSDCDVPTNGGTGVTIPLAFWLTWIRRNALFAPVVDKLIRNRPSPLFAVATTTRGRGEHITWNGVCDSTAPMSQVAGPSEFPSNGLA